MNFARQKAKSAWLISFGDLVTLLITLFILIVVINKGEITKVQKWGESELDKTATELKTTFEDFDYISVKRHLQGIKIEISADKTFLRGGFTPLPELREELHKIGSILSKISFLVAKNAGMPSDISLSAKKDNLVLYREISISGHTDNDQINPESSLRNNWFLSAMRAQSVMEILFNSSGLPAEMFSIAGFGEYRPISSNKTPAGKIKNRRVQILIIANFEKVSPAQNQVISNQSF